MRILYAAALLAAVAVVVPLYSYAQGPNVQKYVDLIDAGQADQVKADLPSLLSTYPNDPGVLYLKALLTSEGSEAARIYQSIVDNSPKSAWADDALYKLYQFYYALGLYRTAEIKMAQLQSGYPDSPYVTGERSTSHPAVAGAAPSSGANETVRAKTAPKSVTEPTPSVPPPAVSTPSRTESGGGFMVQLGAFASKENAGKLRRQVEGFGYPVETTTLERNGRVLYLVRVGPFSTQEEARTRGEELQHKHNVSGLVVPR